MFVCGHIKTVCKHMLLWFIYCVWVCTYMGNVHFCRSHISSSSIIASDLEYIFFLFLLHKESDLNVLVFNTTGQSQRSRGVHASKGWYDVKSFHKLTIKTVVCSSIYPRKTFVVKIFIKIKTTHSLMAKLK